PMKANQPIFSVSYWEGGKELPLGLHVGRHFRLARNSIGEFFATSVPPLLVDLLRIGMSVYVVDRLAKRRQQSQGRPWPRSICAGIKAFHPEFWTQGSVHAALTQCLEFVSGDSWELRFVLDPTEQYVAEHRLPGITLPFDGDPPQICLFSGGL